MTKPTRGGWPKCPRCKGTGLEDDGTQENCCYDCGGRGFILPMNKKQRAALEREKQSDE